MEKSYETFYHVAFVEVCKSYGITPIGFHIKKTPCVGKPSKNFLLLREKELAAAQFKLIELTITESVQNLSDLETEFISKFSLYTVQEGNFQFFRLKSRFFNFCESFIPDFENLHYLLHLNELEDDV